MDRGIGGGVEEAVTIDNSAIRARMRMFGIRLGVVRKPAQHAGKLIVYNWELRKDTMVESVYHAYRQTWHILSQHGEDLRSGEAGSLLAAMSAIRSLNIAITQAGPELNIASMRARVERVIESVAPIIERARALSKQEAWDSLQELSDGTDVLGRLNPAAYQARTVKIHALLRQRLDEIIRIDPHIIRRQHALITMIRLAELRLAAVADFIGRLLASIERLPSDPPHRRKSNADHIGYLSSDLSTVDFNPYREMCAFTASDLRELRDLLALTRVPRYRTETVLKRCQAAFRIKQLHIELERMIFRAMRARQRRTVPFPFLSAEKQLERIVSSLIATDERSFKQPVCSKVAADLNLAIKLLADRRRKKIVTPLQTRTDLHNLGVILRNAVRHL